MTEPFAVAFVTDLRGRDLIPRQLRGIVAVRLVDTLDALERQAIDGGASAVLTELRDRNGRPVLPVLQRLRAHDPALPLIACCAPTPEALADIGAVVQSRLDVGVVLRGHEHIGLAVKRVLARRKAEDQLGALA